MSPFRPWIPWIPSSPLRPLSPLAPVGPVRPVGSPTHWPSLMISICSPLNSTLTTEGSEDDAPSLPICSPINWLSSTSSSSSALTPSTKSPTTGPSLNISTYSSPSPKLVWLSCIVEFLYLDFTVSTSRPFSFNLSLKASNCFKLIFAIFLIVFFY